MANRRSRERETSTRKRTKKNKIASGFFDYSLLFIVLFLVAFGLVMVYSTSSYTAELKTGSSA